MRFNEYRAAQINGSLRPATAPGRGCRRWRRCSPRPCRATWASTTRGCRSRRRWRPRASRPARLRLLAAGGVPDPRRPVRELDAALRRAARHAHRRPRRLRRALGASGLESDVFSQIGLVMVIGLAAKNAILIVEFAKEEYERQDRHRTPALAGARLRLRPILMTAFAFILGVLPLVRASGAGAHGRILLALPSWWDAGRELHGDFSDSGRLHRCGNLTHRHDLPKPGGPAPRGPTPSGDGEAHVPTTQPEPVPAHVRTQGAH